MLIAKILLIGALFLAAFASEETNRSRLSREVAGFNGDRSSRVRKRQEEYFEQCRAVATWTDHLGHVSVLGFLDPSWHYSFRQAVMLNVLNSRLRKSGFPDIRFFVISPPPDLVQDRTEIEDEIEAWRQIATMFPDIENFVNGNVDIFKNGETETIFLQDGPRLKLWSRFRASRNQVIVIDRCGRLTYQVIVPWSILYFPYVKAAILSTYQNDPCGECNPPVQYPEEYLSDLTNDTQEETGLRKADTDNPTADPNRTTERLENALRLNESSEEKHESTSIVSSPASLDEITDNTDRLDPASVTELSVKSGTAYQYDNDTTESSTDESHPGTTGSQGELTSPNHAGEAIAILESQQGMFASNKNDSANSGEIQDLVSMLDEPTTVTDDNIMNHDGISVMKTVMISDAANGDEVFSSDGNANIGSDNLTEYGQNDSVDKSDVEDAARIEQVHFLPLPLRVIMYAPHVHRNSKKTKKYTHLILKTDNPDYHGHFNFAPPTDSSLDSDLQMENSKGQAGIKINKHKEDTDEKYIFDPDEGPGLYGEIADYWRSYEESDIVDRNETSNDNYTNITISSNEQHSSSNISDNSSLEADESYSSTNITDTEDSVDPLNVIEKRPNQINSSESINKSDQVETRNKQIIEHYSKLLAWIAYRLN